MKKKETIQIGLNTNVYLIGVEKMANSNWEIHPDYTDEEILEIAQYIKTWAEDEKDVEIKVYESEKAEYGFDKDEVENINEQIEIIKELYNEILEKAEEIENGVI